MAIIAVVAGALVSAVGCAATESSSPGVAQNPSTWAMPLDEFKTFDPSLGDYAEQLLISECLVAQGYEWPVPWRDIEFPQPATFNATGKQLFTLDIARQYGYHEAPLPNPAEMQTWVEFGEFANSYNPDETFQSRFDACGEDARDPQTIAAVDGLNHIAALEIQAADEVWAMDTVQEAVDRWRTCLSKEVPFELPDDPWLEMPTREMAVEFGTSGPNATETASAAELAAAEADARCRDSSGATEIRYEAEWAAQEALVAQHRDALERSRREAIAHAAELKTVIAEHAPSR